MYPMRASTGKTNAYRKLPLLLLGSRACTPLQSTQYINLSSSLTHGAGSLYSAAGLRKIQILLSEGQSQPSPHMPYHSSHAHRCRFYWICLLNILRCFLVLAEVEKKFCVNIASVLNFS